MMSTLGGEEWKNEANAFFQNGKYDQAIACYTKAIECNPLQAIYFANRAFAYTKLEQYGAAKADASKAIELDKTYAKGYYRRGSANLALGKYKEALKDFKKVVQIYPKNKEAQDKLKQCEKIVRMVAFQDAIAVEETNVADSINVEDFEVEPTYQGIHLPTPITLDFVKSLMQECKNQKKLHVKYVYQLLLDMKALLSSLPSLIEINVLPSHHFTVCGDVHGQYYDLLNIFELNGLPSESNPYLFNGDFVDRGSFSVEVILVLMALKLLYPNHMHLLRGNHESINMNRMYGFEGEVVHKYNKRVFDLFTEVFCWLPLAACINKKVFIVHGGLFSRDGVTLDEIKNIQRNRQPPDEGLMCEALWSDPCENPGRSPNKRGVGIAFGPDITAKFLEHNGLELVVRSHEVKEEGYMMEAGGKLITVFSAPNYCDQVGNKGAFIKFDSDMKPHITSFAAVPHPPIKPMAYASNFSMFF